jgi:hypothetical protein
MPASEATQKMTLVGLQVKRLKLTLGNSRRGHFSNLATSRTRKLAQLNRKKLSSAHGMMTQSGSRHISAIFFVDRALRIRYVGQNQAHNALGKSTAAERHLRRLLRRRKISRMVVIGG